MKRQAPQQATISDQGSHALPMPSGRSVGLVTGALLASAAVLGGTALLARNRARRAEQENPP